MSVNGKPFKPDPTSYQMTGIPVGNPNRYKSRGVIRMCRDPNIPFEDQQVGIPGKGTESQAELELKRLLNNQLDVSHGVTIRKVNFATAAKTEAPISAKGFMRLDQYQYLEKNEQRARELRDQGLTDVQIIHELTKEGITLTPSLIGKKRNIAPHPDYIKHGVEEIHKIKQQRIEEELELAEAQKPKLSRHMLELEASLLHGKTDHPLAHMYIKNYRKDSPSPPSLAPEPIKRKEDDNSSDNHQNGDSNNQNGNNSPNGNNSNHANGNGNSAPQKVVLTNKIEPIPASTIEANRMSDEEIRKIPQFANYVPGTPSKVLYVKNLDKHITVEDLVSIFIRFQEEGKAKIGFKLMDGKMKGQAFITFDDEKTATAALNMIHGFVFKGKPIIIQYGKSK